MVTLNETICEGDTYSMGGTDYDQSGQYITTLSNQYGCDSIVTLNLTVNAADRVTLNETICEGETYSMGGTDYDQSGQYITTLSNQYGCDSIVTLNLTVNAADRVTLNEAICEGDTYSMGGTDYDQSGQYITTLSNQYGCDSIVTLNLTVNAADRVTLNETICEGETYSMGGTDYDQSGQYITTLSNQYGCDSIVTLNLTVNATDRVTLNETICEGETSFHGRYGL